MFPWFRGFTGTFEYRDDKGESYLNHVPFEIDGDRLTIKELPIKVWTRNYKNYLEDLAQKDFITDIRELHKDNTVRFELTVPNLQNMPYDEI